jgi:inward rectifier potassium channel
MNNQSTNELHAAESSKAKPRKITIGSSTIITHGLPRARFQDVYHFAMTISWLALLGSFGVLFILINTFFAILYSFDPNAISNLFPKGFLGAFFFSVETLATVGYGDMHPATVYAHIVATIEIFTGMATLALVTGIMFARFSRPRARILFAENPVIGLMDGKKTLTVRAANARQNIIVDASARLRFIRQETSQEGHSIRRIHDLKLRRDQQPMFTLGWSLMHDIDEGSPLLGESEESLAASEASLVLTIDGVDETTSQTMQSRYVYKHDKLRWSHRYVDLLSTDSDGISHMDYTKFHDSRPETALVLPDHLIITPDHGSFPPSED